MKKFLFFFMLALPFVIGCGRQPLSQTSGDTLRVATSFYVLQDFAEKVGGATVEVFNLVPPGVEPHDFEPSAQDVARLYQSDIFFYQGAGFDGWAETFREDLMKNPAGAGDVSLLVVRMTDSFDLLPALDRQEEDPTAAGDPHIWLDPLFAQEMISIIEQALIDANPQKADHYRANGQNLRAELLALHGEYQQSLTSCQKEEIIVAHDAFSYLGARYGMTIEAIGGMSPEEEPSPARLSELAALAKDKGIRYIFFETLVSPQLAQTLADEVGAQTLVLNPIEGLTSEQKAAGLDYFHLMRENLRNLQLARQCQ